MPANLSDKNLEDVVRKELKKPEGPLTRGDLKRLDKLEVDDDAGTAVIENLFGMEHAVNLTYLDVKVNEIIDIRPLKALSKLTELDLYANEISDIRPLASLTKLTTLYLYGNPLNKDIHAHVTNLEAHVATLQARGVAVEWVLWT